MESYVCIVYFFVRLPGDLQISPRVFFLNDDGPLMGKNKSERGVLTKNQRCFSMHWEGPDTGPRCAALSDNNALVQCNVLSAVFSEACILVVL